MHTQIEHAKLTGDWTIAGVRGQVDRLLGYSGKVGCCKRDCLIQVDCADIQKIDMAGLQLLSVWLHCVKERGLHPALVNLPDCVAQLIGNAGVEHLFLDTCTQMHH